MSNSEKIKGLRELLNFAEESGVDFDLPSMIYLSCNSAEEFSENVKKLGGFNKSADDGYLNATKSFSSGVQLQIYVSKTQTCKRVVVGQKDVPFKDAQLIAAVPAHKEDIVKWECPPSFIDIPKKEPVPA